MLRILRFILIAIQFPIVTLLGLLISIFRPFHPTNSKICANLYAFSGLPIIGMKTKITGQENLPKERGYVVVSNHQSNWDLFVGGSAVPKRTVSIGKKSLIYIPIFGQLYWLTGNVLVDRGNRKKAMDAMAVSKDALMNKRTRLWFFAEGTRNNGNNMLPFKKGAFITAINAGAPIVPICISPYLKNFSLNKLDNGTADISILPAIETKNLSLDDTSKIMDQCFDMMMKTIHQQTSCT